MQTPLSPATLTSPSMDMLFSVIESIHDNVALVDKNGIMLWVSTCFERNYGVSRDAIIGHSTYELEKAKIFCPSVAAIVLRTKRVVTLTELNREHKYNIVTGIPVYDDKGEITFVVSFTVDLRYSAELYYEYEKINTLLMETRTGIIPPVAGIVCQSQAMADIMRTIQKLAEVDTSILITGESGVGKNVVAKLMHQFSKRSAGPFVEINCAGIPDALLESELFGYEYGAFTGARTKGKLGRIELASGGTLFLDEIGELPFHLQAKLLQVIQEKKILKLGGNHPVDVDFRLVTATNQDLQSLVDMKRFRSDLFFRLNVLPVAIPPLRERPEDILPLCASILEEMNSKYGTSNKLAQETEQALRRYSWPGNVRELRNMIERLVVTAEQSVILPQTLPAYILGQNVQPVAKSEASLTLTEALERTERKLVMDAYARHKTTTATAKALGISQPTAARKITKYKQIQE
ncbi:MAG: sigma 54-interacting transcriptional regulator [Bilophila sp.]